MGKNLKIHTKLTIGYIILAVLLIISIYTGYTSAANIIKLAPEEQAGYLSSYATFTAVLFIVMSIMTTGIAVALTKLIRSSFAKLTKAADEMAAGVNSSSLPSSEADSSAFSDMAVSLLW